MQQEKLPELQRIAIAMAAIGDHMAGEVAKHLDDHQMDAIAIALTDLENLSVEDMDRVLVGLAPDVAIERKREWPKGGIDYARSVIERACGPQKTREVLSRALPIGKAVYGDENIRSGEIWLALKKIMPFRCRVATENYSTSMEGEFAEAEVSVGGFALKKVRTDIPHLHAHETYQQPLCKYFDGDSLESDRRGYCRNFTANDALGKMVCPHFGYWPGGDSAWRQSSGSQ